MFSVIIPTRERCDVLAKSLRTVIAQDCDLEIIVSDNDSKDDTKAVVAAIRDPRIRYLNPGRRLSMSENWGFALSHASGDWITIIGDDDGLLPGCLSKVEAVARSAGVDAIRSSVCEYSWPSLTGMPFGTLEIPSGRGFELRSSRQWFSKVVMQGRGSYRELPMLYNGGFVRSAVLKSILNDTGAIYRSRIPDIYSAVAISNTIDKYAYVREPLAINGASRHSTGTAQFASARTGHSAPAKLFVSEQNLPFHRDLPLTAAGDIPPSIQALLYESLLQFSEADGYRSASVRARQLELILAGAGREHGRDIAEWGKRYAEMHGLDFKSIASRARLMGLLRISRKLSGRIEKTFRCRKFGSMVLRVLDVEEAAKVAGQFFPSEPDVGEVDLSNKNWRSRLGT